MILTGAIVSGPARRLSRGRRGSWRARLAIDFARRCSICRSSSSTASTTAHPPGIARRRRPVIYVVAHQSRLDPALMLSLLPDDTLHILDDDSANAIWLEPWRELARTIAFNAEHVFVSRRLVRSLKGKGRLAVYFPDDVEPERQVLPPLSRGRPDRHQGRRADRADRHRRRAPPALLQHAGRQGAAQPAADVSSIAALEPMTLAQLAEGAERGRTSCRQRAVRPPRRGARRREPAQSKPVPGGARRRVGVRPATRRSSRTPSAAR